MWVSLSEVHLQGVGSIAGVLLQGSISAECLAGDREDEVSVGFDVIGGNGVVVPSVEAD